MSIEAIEAVVDLIEMGAVVGQEDIVKCLRSAIEQAERQEPFGYFIHDSQFGSEDFSRLKPEAVNPTETVIALYTAPPQRQPQGDSECPTAELANAVYMAERNRHLAAHGIEGGA